MNINFSTSKNSKSKFNKLMNIRTKYETDDAYLTLFYEIASYPSAALKLTISNEGDYTLKNSNNSNLSSGSLTKVKKSLINQATNYITGNSSNEKNVNLQPKGPTTKEEEQEQEEEEEEQEPGPGEEGEQEQVPGEEQRVPGQGHEEQQVPGEEQRVPGEEQQVPGEEQRVPGQGHEEQQVPGEEQRVPGEVQGTDEPGSGQVEGGKNNRSWWKKALGMSGGNFSDSEYESDGSIISSDDDKEDIVPFSTAFFEDDDEEDIMQHIRNMKSKKYLKTLGNNDLRDILKKNNQKVTKNSNYLSKKDMIKSITQFYK